MSHILASLPRGPLLLALGLSLAFALALPPYSGPDENGHVAYTAALAQGHLPIIPYGPVADIATGTSWQGQHPPLFYALAAPFYILLGNSPVLGLYAMRLLGVVALLATVALVHLLSARLLPPERAHVPAWLVASHPTVTYVCAMANNEALAMALSVASVWAAANAVGDGAKEDGTAAAVDRKWLLASVALGGLGLLCKLTAVAGVLAAAFVLGRGRTKHALGWPGLAVLLGAAALWLPWGLSMHSVHGALVPSPLQRPGFPEGLWAITLYPLPVLTLSLLALGLFAVGLLAPYWLVGHFPTVYYPALGLGWAVAAGVLWIAARRRGLRFAGAGFVALAALVISQVLFRDAETVLFVARYSPPATALASLLAASACGAPASRTRLALGAAWAAWALCAVVYVFYFFLAGTTPSSHWKRAEEALSLQHASSTGTRRAPPATRRGKPPREIAYH